MIEAKAASGESSGPPLALHAGCGGAPLPDWLVGFSEVRLDIDASKRPDVIASMTDLGDIGPFDVVYCSHALEHLSYHDVPICLREFHRVLKPGGYAAIFVPDLAGIMPTEDVVYVSPAGPVTGLDMIYGMRRFTDGCPHMMHRTGFIAETLEAALKAAGFSRVRCDRLRESFNLFGVGVKT